MVMDENNIAVEESMSNGTVGVARLHQPPKRREELEKDLDEAKRELDDIRKERADNRVHIIDKDPVLFVKLVCQGLLGIDTGEANPFLVNLDGQSEFVKRHFSVSREMFGGFAQLILDKIRDDEANVETQAEYVPFLDMIRSWFSGEFKWIEGKEFRECDDLDSVIHTLLGRFGGDLASAIDTCAHQIYEGVPIYREAGTEGMEMLPFDDPLYVYIVKKGEFWETGSTSVVPSWVFGLYVKRSDLDAYDAYFSGSGDLSDEERNMRREALWNTLGISSGNAKSGTARSDKLAHKTRMLNVVQAVIERYYGPQFEDGNIDTVPRQKDVIEWLMQTFDLSKREADSVDVVTRPDFARR